MMKFVQHTLTAVIMVSMLATTAHADTYLGAKYGSLKVKPNDSYMSYSSPQAYSLYAGRKFGENTSVEGEYIGSESFAGKAKVSSIGLYGRYNQPLTPIDPRLYAKGQLGVAHLKLKGIDTDGGKDSKIGIAFGVGVGFHLLPDIAVEAEYKRLPSTGGKKMNFTNIAGRFDF